MDLQYIRDRITDLRLKKGVTEADMSRELGHSKGYIENITSGRRMLPMKEFLKILDYFEISAAEFFREDPPADEQTRILLAFFHSLPGEARESLIKTIKCIEVKNETSAF